MINTKFNSSSLLSISKFQRWTRTKAMSYHWHEFIAVMWPILLASWGVGLFVIWLVNPNTQQDITGVNILFNVLLFAPVIGLVYFRRVCIKDGQTIFQQFLKNNKLKPNKSEGFDIAQDGMPDARFQRIVKKVAGGGETYYSAITVNLDMALPEIVLDAKRNNHFLSSMPNYYAQSQRLHLEGDFDKYFALYAPTKWRIEALSIITPDVMQSLITSGFQFDLEIIGGTNAQFILSTPGYIGFEAIKLQALLDAFVSIFPDIMHQLQNTEIEIGSEQDLRLIEDQAYSFNLLGKQLRLYRTMSFLWTFIGIVLGVFYIGGIRAYVQDLGILYIYISMVIIFSYFKLKKR